MGGGREGAAGLGLLMLQLLRDCAEMETQSLLCIPLTCLSEHPFFHEIHTMQNVPV